MKKIIAYFDMDGPLADFEIGIGRNVGHPKRGIYEHNRDLVKPMYEKGFFRNLPVTAGAKEAVEELLNIDRIDWYIATKPMVDQVYYSATEKFEWLNEHFPMLVEKTFMTCCKSHLNGHYLIDDHKEKWEPIFNGSFLYFDVAKPVESWENIVNYLKKYDPNNLPNRVTEQEKRRCKSVFTVHRTHDSIGRGDVWQVRMRILLNNHTERMVTFNTDGQDSHIVHSSLDVNESAYQNFRRTWEDIESKRNKSWNTFMYEGSVDKPELPEIIMKNARQLVAQPSY